MLDQINSDTNKYNGAPSLYSEAPSLYNRAPSLYNGASSLFNGALSQYSEAPSLVFYAVGVESCNFDEKVTVIRPISSSKLFRGGLIPELKVTILDEYGKDINNNREPITVVLEIINNEHLWRIYIYHHRW